MSWYSFDNGKTLGQKGSEGGETILDDQHDLGARITLEKISSFSAHYFAIKPDGRISAARADAHPESYYAVTCGIYGWFFHTHHISSETAAFSDYEEMKSELDGILKLIQKAGSGGDEKISEISDEISKFVERFI